MGLLARLGKKLKVLGSAPSSSAPRSRGPIAPDVEPEPASPRPAGQPVAEFIAATVKAHPVVLFMKGTPESPRCGFSATAAGILANTGRPFHAVDVLADDAIRDGVKQFSSWPTIPQVFIGGEFVGGSDILAELQASGELQRQLERIPS
jgi:monothiol glutaredoxin